MSNGSRSSFICRRMCEGLIEWTIGGLSAASCMYSKAVAAGASGVRRPEIKPNLADGDFQWDRDSGRILGPWHVRTSERLEGILCDVFGVVGFEFQSVLDSHDAFGLLDRRQIGRA